jgi:hypothetical protein
MSATSFGGSFDSVRTNDNYLKNLFIQHLQEAAIDTDFPFLKWLPFLRLRKVDEMNKITDGIISKRLNSKERIRKDLLQIFLDTHQTNPESFSDKHLQEEMRLFMYVGSLRPWNARADDITGLQAAIPQDHPQLSPCCSLSIIQISSRL